MKRFVVLALLLLAAVSLSAQDIANQGFVRLQGMQLPGYVTREANGIPAVYAFNKHDMYFLNGWLHAQDRLFQMDTLRRAASGTLAELLGSPALSNDVQLRTLGLRRAAEATLPTLSADAAAALQAYADGVNAYVAAHPTLPPEYGLLEVTKFQPWTPADTLAVGKILAFQLSFDTDDIDRTVALLSYQAAGQALGFDGTKFFADTWRSAPFSKAATIPDATGAGSPEPLSVSATAVRDKRTTKLSTDWIKAEALDLARNYLQIVRSVPILAASLENESKAGSNEWAIAGKNTTGGAPLIANDPHLALSFPPNFYPISLHAGTTNVAGMGFPGAPAVIQGQNQRIAWGSTVHPMDVTDIYQEQLVPDASSPSGFSSLYKGAKEQVLAIPQVYRVNNTSNGVSDDLTTVTPSASVPPATLVVPRHGPIIQLDTKTGVALSVQYVGFYATHELEAFMAIDDAQNVNDFKSALQLFDFGSQNFAYADVDGTIAYFTSGELPIREDLQANKVTGLPPYFLRNGQGGNEWMTLTNKQPSQATPFEILPYAEMPQVVNPSNGWFVNANNDPIGQTLDNDPLNTQRTGGGILYLNPGYDGIRAGRITELVRGKLANGGKMSFEDMQAIQADTALLDAEVFVPYIKQAFANAQASANPALAALGAAPAVAAAVGRLAAWDFTTPTGIPTGYDASDVNGALSTPSAKEVSNSVAATIYALWRGRFMANTIDGVLNAIKMPLPPHQQELSALRNLLDNFATNGGRGTSGVPFFNVPGVTNAADARDIVILKSVADAMAMPPSDAFADAFNHSTNPDTWQWGKLHRVVFSHITGLNILEPGATFGLLPLPSVLTLTGVSVDGGYSTVDAATHNPRATTPNGFMFGSGPNRRFVGEMKAGAIRSESSLPGGVSGIPGSPLSTNLLMLWLTNDTFQVHNDPMKKLPWQR